MRRPVSRRPCKVLVAGGGIGGLATAIALLQRGFEVEVFEQAPELREFGAGIQISPNGNRALASLGCFDALQALSCPAEGKEIRLWNTGRQWTLFNLGDSAVKRFGFPYLTVFRPDLLRVLAEAVMRLSPQSVHVGARTVAAGQDGERAWLELDDGRRVEADVVVGADGVHSRVRPALFGDDAVAFSGMVAWRTLIPMDRLPERLRRNVAVNWVGPGGHLVHYPVQGGRLLNFVGTLEGQAWDGAPWRAPGTAEDFARAFAGWHEDIHLMAAQAPDFTRWALCGRPLLPTWTRGRATLLGDACHPTLPFLAQGAVHTLEDAVVLARCLQAHDDPAAALRRYDELRRPRAHRMVLGSAENTSRFHHPSLADPATAEAFIDREWRSGAVSDRYDWLFTYDVEGVEV